MDPAINVSNESVAQEPALTMGKQLSLMQKAMLELSIPKAIYRNAIKEIPTDLEFRIGFLKLYQTFGSSTLPAQEEIYESLKADFANDPIAISVISERHLASMAVSDANYPAALKTVVGEYEKCLETSLSSSTMWSQYTKFLTETLNSVTEPNLQRYVFVILSKAYTRASAADTCTPDMYLAWSKLHNHDTKAKLSVLDKALAAHERNGALWTAKLRLALLESGENSISRVESLVVQALRVVGKSDDADSLSMVEMKTERFAVWKMYLEWAAAESIEGKNETRIEAVERRFRECLSVHELGGTSVDTAELEAYIIVIYLDWSYNIGGIERVRSAADRLLSFKQRSTFFLNACLEFEERDILGGSANEGLVAVAKKSLKSLVTPAQLTRLRKLHELVCFSDTSRIDSWMAYISFEMYVAQDVKRVTEVHWRANKEVTDKDEFALRYDALRTEA
ncbi:hypothetical protein BC830DRAFT_1113943 [Chytriomyces sp. MP71]|nr:hypothetical protein BC830DRAFT_1113943 [Chytriomyces sp. MP71]